MCCLAKTARLTRFLDWRNSRILRKLLDLKAATSRRTPRSTLWSALPRQRFRITEDH